MSIDTPTKLRIGWRLTGTIITVTPVCEPEDAQLVAQLRAWCEFIAPFLATRDEIIYEIDIETMSGMWIGIDPNQLGQHVHPRIEQFGLSTAKQLVQIIVLAQGVVLEGHIRDFIAAHPIVTEMDPFPHTIRHFPDLSIGPFSAMPFGFGKEDVEGVPHLLIYTPSQNTLFYALFCEILIQRINACIAQELTRIAVGDHHMASGTVEA